MSFRRAIIEIVVATVIWGFAFVAVRWSLELMPPLWIVSSRFLVAGGVVLCVLYARPETRAGFGATEVRGSIVPGILLATTLTLQTFGLRETSATNSGFLTALYVLFVPIVELVWGRRRPARAHWVFVLLALVGMALVCGVHAGRANRGDLLTALCAVSAAVHIVVLSERGRTMRSPFTFNAMQSLWAGLFALGPAIAVGSPWPTGPVPLRAFVGFGFVTLVSTVVAFWLQIRAQRVLSASVSSLLFLLESPVAGLAGFCFLNERLASSAWVGAALIIVAAAAAVWVGMPARAGHEKST